MLVVSKPVWSKISPEDQEIVRTAAREWGAKQRGMIAKSDAELVDQLKEKGMTVIEVDRAPFVAAVQPVWEEFGGQFGPELMDILERYRQ